MRAVHNRKTGVIHAAAEFYIDGPNKEPSIGPMCNAPIRFKEYDYGRVKFIEVPFSRVNCLTCRSMEEFKITASKEPG